MKAKLILTSILAAFHCLAGAPGAHGQGNNDKGGSKQGVMESTGPRIDVVAGEYESFDPTDRTKKYKQNGLKEIAVHRNGKMIKKFSFSPGDRIENGHHIRHTVEMLEDKNKTHTVVLDDRKDWDERNPYKIRLTSSTHLLWYSSDGNILCDQEARYRPVLLAEGGRHLVVVDDGFDQNAGLENYDRQPDANSPEQKDVNLFDSYLYILNDKCQIVYSTASRNGGWEGWPKWGVWISPSGMWLALNENGASSFVERRGWEYFLKVVDLNSGRTNIVKWDRDINPEGINDEGIMRGKKSRQTGEIYTYKDSKGNMRKARRLMFQHYEWKPGMKEFQAIGTETKE